MSEPLYFVYNETDGIIAYPEPMTRAECDEFMTEFRVRFTEQGYYLTAAGYEIPAAEVRLKRIALELEV